MAYHEYEPFGMEMTPPYQDDEAKKFTGHERDFHADPGTSFDLDYMHARYYSPWERRFLSVDPVGGDLRVPQSWNGYSYVLGNPMNLVDPNGETIHVVYSRTGVTDDEWSQIQDNVRRTFGEAGVDVVFHEKGSDTVPSETDLGSNDRIQTLDIDDSGLGHQTEGNHSVVSADRAGAETAPAGGFVLLMSNVISHELGHGTSVLLNYNWHLPAREAAGDAFKRGFKAMPLGQDFYTGGTYKGNKTVMYPRTANEFYTKRLEFSAADKTVLGYYFGRKP